MADTNPKAILDTARELKRVVDTAVADADGTVGSVSEGLSTPERLGAVSAEQIAQIRADALPKGEPTIITDRKALKKWQTNHDLHVLMIMNKHDIGKAEAIVQAYHEGNWGLSKRLGVPQMMLESLENLQKQA